MTNLSLKEQLQAAASKFSSSSETGTEKKKPQLPNQKSSKKEAKKEGKPIWLAYLQYGVELLKVYYPLCFKESHEVKPLKIGIKEDLLKKLSGREDIVIGDKACMVKGLTYYVNTSAYYKRMVEDAARIDLDGNPAGNVTLEEAQYSAQRWQSKNQKKLMNGEDGKVTPI